MPYATARVLVVFGCVPSGVWLSAVGAIRIAAVRKEERNSILGALRGICRRLSIKTEAARFVVCMYAWSAYYIVVTCISALRSGTQPPKSWQAKATARAGANVLYPLVDRNRLFSLGPIDQ